MLAQTVTYLPAVEAGIDIAVTWPSEVQYPL